MEGIAIIGMAGRFPGARDVAQFWDNLKNGVESISRFADGELAWPPLAAANADGTQRQVNARGIVADADQFDAAFFGIHARDAELMDPQQRVFLECAWEALEHAGCDPACYPGLIGVWAGASFNSYLLYNLCSNREYIARLVCGYQQTGPSDFLGNDKDFLATRVSYKLNLRGPSLTVQTACSTSLVAVAQACQALLAYQCDMALAGGVSISFPQRRAYPYQEGGMASTDGHTRTFDADAAGVVFSDGAGCVTLKRLSDAQADGDQIFAVIKGTAVNNDGAGKVSFTAPSVDGQAEVIQLAQALAGVEPQTVSYVEAHGTATPLGDPIELAGLTQAFRAGGAQGNSFCAIGSLKTNVGHLETASGVAALIKTALALKHAAIPPSLHFRSANPKLELANSPFYVNTRLLPWAPCADGTPRRAGVSSFGVGGTNAHAVLEEAPADAPFEPSVRGAQLFVLSAKTGTALDAATANLARHFRDHPALDPADAAFTLALGRQPFVHRRVVAAGSLADAAAALEAGDPKRVFTGVGAGRWPSVAFLFPGQGSQAVNMGSGLYRDELVFRGEIDRCAELLRPWLDGVDLRDVLYPADGGEEAATVQLNQTRFTQPALFVFGYALAKLWMSWGVAPAAMLGHSVGEYVAACLAGVFTLEDGLRLVAERARMVQALPGGGMLAVRLPEADLAPLLATHDAGLSLAAVNSPALCVVSGPEEALLVFERETENRRVATRRLNTSHAFHSAMLEPVVEPFAALVRTVPLAAPRIPFVSNVTGRFITDNEATDPMYWASHLREAVRFADGIGEILKSGIVTVLLEVGPGQVLAPLARQHPTVGEHHAVILSTLQDKRGDTDATLTTLGRMWVEGVEIDWNAFYAGRRRRRVTLPTYPFERKRFWIEPVAAAEAAVKPAMTNAVSHVPPEGDDQLATTVEPEAMPHVVTPPVLEPPARKEAIVEKIRSILKTLSGQDQSSAAPNISFLELGFDSLFLTQVAGTFRKEFGVKVTFRQLLEDFSTMDTLAAHLDTTLPPEVMRPAATLPPPVPNPAPPAAPVSDLSQLKSLLAPVALPRSETTAAATGDSVLERVIQEQLRVMAQQLEMLRGSPMAPTASSVPVPATASPVITASTGSPVPTSASPMIPAKVEAKAFGPYRPIDKAPGGGFTPRQQEHLDALIARTIARTPKSKQLTQENRAHFSDPRTVSGFRQSWKEMVYPIVTERSAGSRLWDIDGHEYVDLTMGFGTNLLGHSPAFVTTAIEDQLKRGVEVGPQSPLAGKVAALLCELTGAERAAFTNTGSEAVLAAVRLARTVTGRTRIATCGGFHGINDEVLVRANVVDGQRRSVPVAPGIPEHIVSEVLVVDYGTAEGLELLRAHAHELAAILIEPVQSRRPDLQPCEFLHAAREIATQGGCALIFDEVITGFRCHPGGAQAYFGVEADLATWGKVMGGGMPVGALTGKAEYMDALDGGGWQYGDGSFPETGVTFFAGTYIRHPLTLAASWAVLNHLKREGGGLQRRLNERTGAMVGELNCFFEASGVPLHLENFASIFYPRFDEDIKFGSLMYFHLRAKGVHTWEGRPCFLSTAHTDADVSFIVRAFKETIREMQTGGFLPGEPLPEEPAEDQAVHHVAAPNVTPTVPPPGKPLEFSLYYFGNYPAAYHEDKYRLILESAKFADEHGFSAVWLPERHFHAVGGFSPNPSLIAAALARDTRRIALRGGSVVLPLHHPVRVAEEWSVVDNLSHGRVGVSIASGWHPNDFIFAPERFERRREICLEDIQTIQKLWRGETLPMRAGAGGDFDVSLFPRPLQPSLPVWLTCIHEESFVKAGELGVGVLGYLMNQSVEEVAAKIARYREALAQHGHDPAKGHVTILVHTFVSDDTEAAREKARGPLREYLRSFLDNSQKRLESRNGPVDVADEDLEYLLDKSFNDYVQGKALIGTPASCAGVVERLREIGVDEIGCFIDFGVDVESVLASLPMLDQLRARYAAGRDQANEQAPPDRTLPLSETQSGLWVLGQTDETALRAYTESTTLEWSGPLDLDALHRALQKVVDRHEALRTTIGADSETQIIHGKVFFDLPLLDLSGDVAANDAERSASLSACWQNVEATRFDFEHGPIFLAQLVRLSPEHHLLSLTFHHLLGNGPSYFAVLDEVTALYEVERTGQAAALPTPMQLTDFVAWRAAAAQETQAQDEAFWLERFAGGVPTLELPTDRTRPALRTHRGGRRKLRLGRQLTSALRKTAAAARGSLFMVLLTGFEVLLHRLSGQNDVVVGVPFEGEVRGLPGGDRLFANTTNVMPLRSRAGEETHFDDLFAATKDFVFEANEHQDYFFGRLLKKLGIAHDPSRSPMFATFFNYESGTFARQLDGGHLRVTLNTDDPAPYRGPRDTSMFELYFNVAEQDGELLCECDYSTDLLDAQTVERWLGHYRTLLESIASPDGPATSVWKLPLLDAGERHRMLVEWNDTAADFSLETCLHELIDAQMTRTPEATALVFEGRQLTYGQLRMRSNQLANHLRGLGVGPEVLVGVCMERSFELIVALLGVLKAGGAYVPLDADYPAERLTFMVADARLPVVLTQAHLSSKLPPLPSLADDRQPVVLRVDEQWDQLLAGESTVAPVSGVDADNAAYVIYTSGSTGQPKGITNNHRNIANRLHWKQAAYPLTPQDRLMQKTPFSFDVSVPEFFAPLMAGATMIIARPGAHGDSGYLVQLILEQGVTDIHFVPPMLALFLEEKNLGETCVTLRRVNCSGEALSSAAVQRFCQVFGAGVELLNLYGPTEAAVEVTCHRCVADDCRGNVPIGRPVSNTQMYILDCRGEPVPIGVPGELLIGGVQVARGYLGRPELTAEKFVPDPFGPQPDGQLYRTGDLARYLPDGEIDFLGRMDFQAKIRGFRVELGEIETVLNSHSNVCESVVIVREDRPGDRQLAAYLVLGEGTPPIKEEGAVTLHGEEAATLRAHLRQRLPEYMVPAALVALPALPLLTNGKVNRRALPAPNFQFGAASENTETPSTPLEKKLIEIWSAVLGLDHVSVHSNFFESGGDSLLGLRIINRLRDLLGEHISLVIVFEAPTVRQMAALLEKNYAVAVQRSCGLSRPTTESAASNEPRINEAEIARMRGIIGRAPALRVSRLAAGEAKNPRAIFILSPMRSGSTLLRIMLAGNPALFSPPELQLLQFDTLAERRDAFSGYDRYMQEGTVRAVMQSRHCGLEEAQTIMAQRETSGEGTRQFYQELQAWVAPQMLVDKTPDYAMDLEVLRRAEECFEGALYIHLVRHPLGMIRSYEAGRFILESPYRGRHDYSARQLAELTWLISHRNISEFLQSVPTARQHRVRFEDVLAGPQAQMEALSEFLGVKFDLGMLQPYENQQAKMTDGVHPMSSQVGDFRFYEHGALKPETADRWRAEYTQDFLGDPTWEAAARFGYKNPFAGQTPPKEIPAMKALPPLVAVSRDARRVKRSVLK